MKKFLWLNFFIIVAAYPKRPTAIKYTGLYKEMPKIWQDYIDNLEYSKKKEAIKTLKDILIESDMLFAEKILQYNIAKGVKDIKSLMVTYYAFTENGILQNKKLQLPENVPDLIELKTDLNVYDNLMSGGLK